MRLFLKILFEFLLPQSDGLTGAHLGAAFGKCPDSKVFCLFFVCFLGQHWGCQDETKRKTVDDALEDSEVLVIIIIYIIIITAVARKRSRHSAKMAGGRLQLNTYTPYLCGFE